MFHECVVFFGCAVGKWVKPVGIVACTVVDGPALHSVGNRVGNFARKCSFVVDSVDKGIIRVLWKVFECFLLMVAAVPETIAPETAAVTTAIVAAEGYFPMRWTGTRPQPPSLIL